MPNFDALRLASDNRQLIRKTQKALCFLAPLSVAIPAELFTAEDEYLDLHAEGWLPLGHVTPDGFTYERSVETEDIDALGYASSRRTDITRVPRSVTATALESFKKHMMELLYGVNLDGVTPNAETGEVAFDEPDLPLGTEYRMLIIAADGPTGNFWGFGRGFYSVKLTSGGGDTWGQEGAKQNELTFTISADDEKGVPVRHYFGGSGAKKARDILGYSELPDETPEG